MVKAARPIPFALTIRNAKTEEIVISTPIDYEHLSLQEVKDILQHYHLVIQQRNCPTNDFCKKSYFAKLYNVPTTNGMDLTAVGRAMRAAGFSPKTHRILSWYQFVQDATMGTHHGHLSLHRPDLYPSERLILIACTYCRTSI